ncbi:MAG: nucleotide exchange factor GrpE [Clostridia bacterium]|nr:nucleotide exchange factor GrpE [Clostridia bacterium]
MAKSKKEEPQTEKEETKVQQEQEQTEASETDALKKELEQKNDQLLRLAAEYDNFRKRSQREKDAIYSDVKMKVLGDILPVIDNFERAADTSGDDIESFKKGFEMIHGQLGDVLKKHSVEAFGEVGESFDPNLHNAVMHIENEELGENVISRVFSKGYKIGDKVIRPATVQVAN